MRTASRNRSGVPKACCTSGETRAKAPRASSRRKASIWRWMTTRISTMSAPVTGPLADAATAAESARNATRIRLFFTELGSLRRRRDLQQTVALGEDLLGVGGRSVAPGSVVELQPGLQRLRALDVLLQDFGPDVDVALGVEHR